MKKVNQIITTAIICMVTTINSFATIKYVNNSTPAPSGPATLHFTTVAAALPFLGAGDTLLIEGSPNSYGAITINIGITVIGAGHHPQTVPALTTTVGAITITASNVSITGLQASTISLQSNASNTTIRRCSFTQINTTGFTNSGLTIEGCVISGLGGIALQGSGQSWPNLIVRNNVITGTILNVNGVNQVTSLMVNNVFLSNSTGWVIESPSCSNFIFANNILAVNYGSTNGSGSVFYTHNVEWTNFGFPGNAGPNQVNVNPLFTNFASIAGSFSYASDFHLQGTSPGLLYGTDGTDVGVYGGTGQQFTYNQNGEPAIPIVRLLQITNPVVQAGTPLNVNFITNVKQ